MMSDFVCPECGIVHGHGECRSKKQLDLRAVEETLRRHEGYECGEAADAGLTLLAALRATRAALQGLIQTLREHGEWPTGTELERAAVVLAQVRDE